MFPQRKFRIAKECHFKESFFNFINANYEISLFDSLKSFINELSQYRNLIGFLSGNEKDENKILKDITNCEIYISTLNFLMSKIDIKINFSWRESCNDQETNSTNFHYEICSVLYNIAICKCILGYNLNNSQKNVELLKKSVKFYKEAAGTFEEIRSIVNEKLKKENFPDFSENYLKCCKDFCIAEAQIILCKFSEIKGLKFDIQAKLNYGVFVLLNRCMSYSLNSFKADKTIVQYEREFFCAKAFYFKKKSLENDFKNFGNGLSEMICLLSEAIKLLNFCIENINKVKNVVEKIDLSNFKENLEKELENLNKLNKEIYKEKIKNINEISLESEIKIEISFPKNLQIPIESSNILNTIFIPNEIKKLLSKFQYELNNYLNFKLNQIENEDRINKFLNERNIPFCIENGVSNLHLNQEIYDNLQSISQKGGFEYLKNQLKTIQEKRDFIENLLNNIENKLLLDKENDEKNQILYGKNWNLIYNKDFINKCLKYKEQLNVGKNLDFQVKDLIMKNVKYYELIGLPKFVIEARIPSNIDKNKIQNLESKNALKFAVDKLNEDKNKLKNEINFINNEINNNFPINDLKECSNGNKNIDVLIDENKKKIDFLFEKIENFQNEIKNDFNDVDTKFIEFAKNCNSLASNENQESQMYISFLSKAPREFEKNVINTNNSINFYNQFLTRIQPFQENVDNYLADREIKKKELIEKLCKEERYKIAQNSLPNNNNNNFNNNNNINFNNNNNFNNNFNNNNNNFNNNNFNNNNNINNNFNNNNNFIQNAPLPAQPSYLTQPPQTFNQNNQLSYKDINKW